MGEIMICKECPDWEPNKKSNYTYGICKREGEVVNWMDRELVADYKEEKTRNNNKTRPSHVCDVINIVKGDKTLSEKRKAAQKKGWSTKDILIEALEDVRTAGVPIPKAIEGFEEEDIFPSTNSLKDNELGELLFKYGALKGYVRWLLFTARAEYNSIHNARVILQGVEVRKLELEDEKKRLKEGLESTAILDSEKLTKLWKKEQKLETRMDAYQSLYDIYSDHWSTVSREISNRSDEIRSGLRQGNIS